MRSETIVRAVSLVGLVVGLVLLILGLATVPTYCLCPTYPAPCPCSNITSIGPNWILAGFGSAVIILSALGLIWSFRKSLLAIRDHQARWPNEG